MTELRLRGQVVNTVFDLLGANENDMTFSLGWALARCPEFLDSFVKRAVGRGVRTKDAEVPPVMPSAREMAVFASMN
jgi:hypothetical protein